MSFDALKDYVARVATKTINNGQEFNTVATGTIKQSFPGYYTVALSNSNDNTIYNAIPLNTVDTFNPEDYVYLVKAPVATGDNFNTKYYIFGLVSTANETYANLSDYERFIARAEQRGVIDDIDYADAQGVEEDAGKSLSLENQKLLIKILKDENAEDFFEHLNKNLVMTFSAYFSCNNCKNKISDYGFEIQCWNEDGLCQTAEGVSGIYYFGSGYFTGQPFDMDYIFQKRVIRLDSFTTKVTQLKFYLYIVPIEGKFSGLSSDEIEVSDMKIESGVIQDLDSHFSVTIKAANNGKDYFRSIAATALQQDVISLQATPYYDSQPLSSDSIQYYWFIKDETIVKNEADGTFPSQYNSIAGEGWRCLNKFTLEPILESTSSVKVWDNKNNIINIDEYDWSITNQNGRVCGTLAGVANPFNSYENIIKCIVKYQGSVSESEEFIVHNFSVHDFKAVLSSSSDTNRLVQLEDRVTLTCTIDNYNEYVDSEVNEEYYSWIIKGKLKSTQEWIEIAHDLGSAPEQRRVLQIKDDETESKNSANDLKDREFLEYELPQRGLYEGNECDYEKYSIKCHVQIKVDAADAAIDLYSNEIEVESLTYLASSIQTIYIYKYYISKSMNVFFEKEGAEGKWSGDWLITDATQEDPVSWIELKINNKWLEDNPIDPNTARQAINYLSTNSSTDLWLLNNWNNSDELYLYYTKKELLYEYKGTLRIDYNATDSDTVYNDDITPIEEKNWEEPILLRKVKVNGSLAEDIRNATEIEQINIFNKLTNNGREQGIFYQDDVYVLTTDRIPQSGVTYYTRNGNTYEKCPEALQEFSPSTRYYIKTDSKTNNKLYINAEYINSGALRIGDEEKELFYANVENPEVKIAGFTVNSNSISHGNGDTLVYLGEDGLEIGTFVNIDVENQIAEFKGKITATELEIGEEIASTAGLATQSAVNSAISAVNTSLVNAVEGLQNQIDGEITSWFEAGTPIDINVAGSTTIAVNENPPSQQWTDNNEKIKHEGDLYYDTNTQYCFRWIRKGEDPNYTWEWVQIADEGITEALAAAAAAEMLADKKRQIFYLSEFNLTNLPNDYKQNDMLVVGTLAATAGSTSEVADTQIYICITDRGENEKSLDHWKKATDMVNSSVLNSQISTINTTINTLNTTLQGKIDEKVDIWYNTDSNDPSSSWSAEEKEKHTGDLWYKTNGAVYYWTGSEWQHTEDPAISDALAVANNAKGLADSKRQIFYIDSFSQENIPAIYDINDLLIVGTLASDSNGADTQFYICTTKNTEADNKSIDHWTLATDIATKSELSSQVGELAGVMETNINSLQTQIDNKIDTWFYTVAPHPSTETDDEINSPAQDWDTTEKQDYHLNDLYYNSLTGYCYQWIKTAESKYYWSRVKDEDIVAAAEAASNAQATADGKITTFYGSTTPTNAQEGDLWLPGQTDSGQQCARIYVQKEGGGYEWVRLDDSPTQKEVNTAINSAKNELTTNYTELINNLDSKYSGSMHFTASYIESDGEQIPAIILKAKTQDTDAGLIYFNTDQLVINSTNLKLNYNLQGHYEQGFFQISTDYFSVSETGEMTTSKGDIGGLALENKFFHSRFYEIGFYGGGYDFKKDGTQVPQVTSDIIPSLQVPKVLFAGSASKVYEASFPDSGLSIEAPHASDSDDDYARVQVTIPISGLLDSIIPIEGAYGITSSYIEYDNIISLTGKTEPLYWIGGYMTTGGSPWNPKNYIYYDFDSELDPNVVSYGSGSLTFYPPEVEDNYYTGSCEIISFKGYYRWLDPNGTQLFCSELIDLKNEGLGFSLVVQESDPIYPYSVRLQFPDYTGKGYPSGARPASGSRFEIAITELKIQRTELAIKFETSGYWREVFADFQNGQVIVSVPTENVVYNKDYPVIPDSYNKLFSSATSQLSINERYKDDEDKPVFLFKYHNKNENQASISHSFYVTDEGKTYIENLKVNSLTVTNTMDLPDIDVFQATIDYLSGLEITLKQGSTSYLEIDYYDGIMLSNERKIGHVDAWAIETTESPQTSQSVKFTSEYPLSITSKKSLTCSGQDTATFSASHSATGASPTATLYAYTYNTKSQWTNSTLGTSTAKIQAESDYYHNDGGTTGKGSATLTCSSVLSSVSSNGSNKVFNTRIIADAATLTTKNTSWVKDSDRNKKINITPQPESYSKVFDLLEPVIFQYKDNSSNRYHTGLIAQDVEQALFDANLTTQDLAAICYDIDFETQEKKDYGIRYDELISMCIYEIQNNKKRIAELEALLKV